MSVPSLYTQLPTKTDGTPDLDLLSDLNDRKSGTDGEEYCLLSYFPKTLKYSLKNHFVVNKYVCFILNPENGKNYDVDWSINIFQGATDISDQFIITEPIGRNDLEFIFKASQNDQNQSLDNLIIKISCILAKEGVVNEVFEIEHNLESIELDFYSDPKISGSPQNLQNESGVYIGNESVTHFIAGHLRKYLIDAKKTAESNNTDVFVNLTASIIYNNCLANYDSLVNFDTYGNFFDTTFTNFNFLNEINEPTNTPFIPETTGICSLDLLNIHHILIDENLIPNRFSDLLQREQAYFDLFDFNYEDFIKYYHICTFPKSAINHSLKVFKYVFDRFKIDAIPSTKKIYHTYETMPDDQKTQITEWKNSTYLETKDNDMLLKNILAEYKYGCYDEINSSLIASTKSSPILRIDWSPFIIKLLEPTSVSIPFELVKIQVLDVRSGIPIQNALIKKLEFHSFYEDPINNTSILEEFKYEIKNSNDSSLLIIETDSDNKRVQKILKMMGYFTGTIGNDFTAEMKEGIFKYFSDPYRDLSDYFTIPANKNDVVITNKKEEYIQYIMEDFRHNCITDEEGLLFCRIPKKLLEGRKLNIHIGFSQFATALERLKIEEDDEDDNISPILYLKRNSNRVIPGTHTQVGSHSTDFNAVWRGDEIQPPAINPNQQNLDWAQNISSNKNFGWEIFNKDGTESRMLKIGHSIELKKSETQKFDHSDSHFSTYFDTVGIHFVFFGMQWCQPVWQPLPTTTTSFVEGGVHAKFMQSKTNRITNPNNGKSKSITKKFKPSLEKNLPVMCTRYNAGSDSSYQYGEGRDYGALIIKDTSRIYTTDRKHPNLLLTTFYPDNKSPRIGNGNKGHYGIDYFAKNKVSSVFALMSGKILRIGGNGGYGRIITLKHKEFGAYYAHLDSISMVIPNDGNVLAGTILAKAGRTNNIGGTTFYISGPTHLHLEIFHNSDDSNIQIGQIKTRLAFPTDIIKYLMPEHNVEANRKLILNNNSKRLFPCDCNWPTSSEWNAARCAIRDDLGVTITNRKTSISSKCWASRNLHCPYLRPTNWNSLTTARKKKLNIFRIQSQLTYLYQDDSNKLADGTINPAGYINPNGIDGDWGPSAQNAIRKFRELHKHIIFPPPSGEPPIIDLLWESRPKEGDATWNELNKEHVPANPSQLEIKEVAPYPRTNLNRVDK